MNIKKWSWLIFPVIALAACETTPEPQAEAVVIPPPVVPTCTPLAKLERVVIPAETKKYTAITEIDNPPYEPIVRKEERTRVIKEEQVLYVDSQGKEVTDICEEQAEPDMPVNDADAIPET